MRKPQINRNTIKNTAYWLCFIVFLHAACGQTQRLKVTDAPTDSIYTFARPQTVDGSGKFYQGREIAPTMSHFGAAWLDRAERLEEERTDLLLAEMKTRMKPTDVVADVGAGSGYFSLRLAPMVPQGKVLASDIQPQMLAMIDARKQNSMFQNVETVLGTITDPKLPANSVDWVILVDAYHEFSHPYEMMRNIAKSLKPTGKVILLEYRAEDADVPIKKLHKMTEAQAKKEMQFVGLQWLETKKNLPWQHLMVFGKEKP